MRFDKVKVQRAIEVLHGDRLYELRYVNGKKVYSGYFKGSEQLIEELERLPENGGNVYITLQAINTDCYNREQRNMIMFGKTTTQDTDIIGYRHLLIDLDPVRPAGIGSNAAQLAAAKATAGRIFAWLRDEGFPAPIIAMSGNGWHLLYRIALEKTDENVQLVKDCLNVLDMFFSDGAVHVDTTVFNPSRICKLYGTYACKGADTEETPHRLSEIVTVPKSDEIGNYPTVTKELLQKLAANLPAVSVKDAPKQAYTGEWYKMPPLPDWLEQHNVPIREVITTGGITKYILECCPFNSDHKGKDASVFLNSDGSYGFKCFHNSCSDKHWKQFRAYYEPDAYTRGEPDTSIKPNHSSVNYQPERAIEAFSDTPQAPPSNAPTFYTLNDILGLPEVTEEYIPTGIHKLDSCLGGLKKGLVTCVSGLRGSGKSSLLSQMVLHAVLSGGCKAAIFSGELTARTAANWFFLQAAGINGTMKYEKFDNKHYVPVPNKKVIADTIDDRLYIYNNDYGNNYSAVIGKLDELVKAKKVDLILLDNLMSLDINCIDPKDKYRSQSLFVERMENFAKSANIHIIFVAHPRKAQGFLRLDDISGSGDIANRVDNAIIIHRRNADFITLSQQHFKWAKDHALYAAGIGNVLEICKDRENGTQDEFIPLYFEPQTKRLKNSPEEQIDYFGEAFGEVI